MTVDSESITAAQITASVGRLRVAKSITGFDFKPSIGILAKDLDKLGLEFTSLRKPLRSAIEVVMRPSIVRNFNVGGRPPWAPLAEYTVKQRHGAPVPILERTGRLRRVGSSLRIWTITPKAASIQKLPASIFYGGIHQAGAEGGGLSAGRWFDKYKRAARQALGPEASDKEINDEAFAIFDKRLSRHGPAPADTAAIPARPWAVFQDDDLDEIREVFADWFMERARRVGRFI